MRDDVVVVVVVLVVLAATYLHVHQDRIVVGA